MCGNDKNKIVHLQGKYYLNLYINSLILRAWKNNIQTKLQLALNIVLDRLNDAIYFTDTIIYRFNNFQVI